MSNKSTVTPAEVDGRMSVISTKSPSRIPNAPIKSGAGLADGATPRPTAKVRANITINVATPVPIGAASASFWTRSAAISSGVRRTLAVTPPAASIPCCSATAASHFD